MAVFPASVLSVDVEFLCEKCDAPLIIDARWHGRAVTCATCAAETRVPLWWNEPAPPAIVQLSGAEIEFLSGFTDPPVRAGAA